METWPNADPSSTLTTAVEEDTQTYRRPAFYETQGTLVCRQPISRQQQDGDLSINDWSKQVLYATPPYSHSGHCACQICSLVHNSIMCNHAAESEHCTRSQVNAVLPRSKTNLIHSHSTVHAAMSSASIEQPIPNTFPVSPVARSWNQNRLTICRMEALHKGRQ